MLEHTLQGADCTGTWLLLENGKIHCTHCTAEAENSSENRKAAIDENMNTILFMRLMREGREILGQG